MASPLLNTSARRGSAFRRVVSAAAALSTAPSGAEGLAVRRAGSLPLSPLRRHLASGAQAQPPKSPNEQKIIELLEKILATRSLPEDAVVDIFASAVHARREAYKKDLSRSFQTSVVLVAGGLVGYSISRI